jgi:hypothetical protein
MGDASAEWRVTEAKKQWEIGVAGGIGMLIGGVCVLVSAVSLVNTIFNLRLALGSYGTSTPLPNSYDAVAGLFAVGVLIIVLSAFGSFVLTKFAQAKGKPLVRVGIILGALTLLALAGRGLQVIALTSTYGSMLAYYATDGDLDDVKAELAKKPAKEDLDQAVSRAAQYNNAPALALLLEAGADMRESTMPEQRRRCPLNGRSYEFIKTAIDHGIKVDACPRGEFAIYEAVDHGRDDVEVEKIVKLLVSAGFPVAAKPDYARQNPLELANSKKWPLTVKALQIVK